MKSIAFHSEVWDFLRAVSECVANAFQPVIEDYGLTLMQTRILVEIKERGGHTVGSLGCIIGLSSGNASSMCKKLEKAGFLKRIRNPEDERYVQLALTQFGDETIQEIGNVLEKKYGAFLEGKDEEEFRRIFQCMQQLSLFIRDMSEFGNGKL